ncbi:MAG TPA: thioredoxin domain-containing protein [Rhodospirillaceae bacterium]|nr:thioredoxin domain-containing protein [Rhodospirillaceae bacterium]
MNQNLLAAETSPYLLQHKDNPVHWHPWNSVTLAKARAVNKPILLSIGYSACHWCHVMARESFENEAVAGLMNELFINIKVDREERPDLDAVHQTALNLMGKQGGWPLTMFLTPEGEPFWGGTYFPPTPLYGQPAFVDVLHSAAGIFHRQKEKVRGNVSAIRQAMSELSRPAATKTLSMDLIDKAAEMAVRMVDFVEGGTVGAPKFPQPCFFSFLWRAHRRTGSSLSGRAVTLTLDKISEGGLYDHLAGGFARYATDDKWLVPHFEKMLYDNAQLIELLSEVWVDTRNPLYAARVRETIAWALADMRVDGLDGEGGMFAFASSMDADSEGEEGRYYVWTEAEIDGLLGTDAPLFKETYGVTRDGNWRGKTILNRGGGGGGGEAVENKLARGRKILLEARSLRVGPGRDDKVLADWNGLMIAALAKAGAVFGEPAWLEAAKTVFSFVCRRMIENGRLRHSWRRGRLRHAAVVDDYANMCRAALALYEATGGRLYLERAEAWVALANLNYWDASGGGYFLAADDADDVITRSKTIADNAQPSGNGTMAEVLARLFYLTGEATYRRRGEELIRVFSSPSPEHLINLPGLTSGFELFERAVQIVVIGRPEEKAAQALRRAVFETAPWRRVLTLAGPGAELPASHPARGKGLARGGKPVAYVCSGVTCGLPIVDSDVLKDELGKL